MANNLIFDNVADSQGYGFADGFGGGVMCQGGQPIIVGNTITSNTGNYALDLEDTNSSTIINNIVAFNTKGIYETTYGPITIR